MKAADAETLGGLPAADFVTRNQLAADEAAGGVSGHAGMRAAGAVHSNASPTGSGTKNTIPIWTGASTLGNSVITETGSTVTVKGSVVGESATATAGLTGTSSVTTGLVAGVNGVVSSKTTNSAG